MGLDWDRYLVYIVLCPCEREKVPAGTRLPLQAALIGDKTGVLVNALKVLLLSYLWVVAS